MKKHAGGGVVLVGVAVDALSVCFGLHKAIAVNVRFVKGSYVALRQHEFFVCHIGWLYETIRDIRVDGVIGDIQLKGFVRLP